MNTLLKKPLIGLKGGVPVPPSKSKPAMRTKAEKKKQKEIEKKERKDNVFKGQLDLDRFIFIRRLDEFCFSENRTSERSD